MRSKAMTSGAVVLVLIGLVALLAGIGLRTWWLPPATTSIAVQSDQQAPLTVVDPSVLSADEGASMTIAGNGDFTVSTARASDVDAWVGDAAHNTISREGDEALKSEYVDGEKTVPNPEGADTFISSEKGSNETGRDLSQSDLEGQALLLAADGTAAAPSNVTITMQNDQTTPWAVPLIVLGALALIAGIIVFVMAGRRPAADSTNDDPAAPWKRGGAAALVLVAAGALTATAVTSLGTAPSAYAEETAQPTEQTSSQQPVLQEVQVERIMKSVSDAVAAGDKDKSAKALEPRMAAAALAQREANYKIRAKAPKYAAPEPIANGPVLVQMQPSETAWPREALFVTEAQDGEVPQVLSLVQSEPRANYRVVSVAQMLPGTTFPQTAAHGPVVDKQAPGSAEGLKQSPEAALGVVAKVLDAGKPEYTDQIAKNAFIDSLISGQSKAVKANPDAVLKSAHTVRGDETFAWRTADGGSLVIGALTNAVNVKPKKEGATIALPGELGALAPAKETKKPVDLTYGESVVLYVPPAGSTESVRVVGASQELLSVVER